MSSEKPNANLPTGDDVGAENDEMMVRELARLSLLVSVCAQVSDTDLDFLFGDD